MADTDAPPPDDATPPEEPTTPPESETLGEGGISALRSEREARKAAEADLATLRTELDDLRRSQLSDQDKALEDARQQGRDEATTEYQDRLLNSDIRAAAAAKFADPSDAVALIPRDGLPDGSEVDTEALNRALDALLEAKPHLAATRPSGVPPLAGSSNDPGPASRGSLDDVLRQAIARGGPARPNQRACDTG